MMMCVKHGETGMADLRDSTCQRGLVGITSRFHPARFDKLVVIQPKAE